MKRRNVLQAFIGGIVAFFVPVKVVLAAPGEPKFAGYSGTRSPGDMFTMIWGICQHVKATGDDIYVSDNPRKLTLGYTAIAADGRTVAEWNVHLRQVKGRPSIKRSNTPLDWRTGPTAEARELLVYEYVKTPTGRAKIANSFPGQRRHSERDRCSRRAWLSVQTSP